MRSRGYYMNSLRAKRQNLLDELRRAMARYASLERQHHPDKGDQGLYIDLLKKMVALVDAEMDNVNTDMLIEQSATV